MNKNVALLLAIPLLLAVSRPVYAAETPVSDPSAKPATLAFEKDTRALTLRAYLEAKHSPFADSADHFVKEADRLNMDWKLVAAIAGVESTFGQHIPTGSYNAWGWGVFTGASDGIHFQGWNDGITKVSQGLHDNYIGKGAKTIDEIGRIYAASPAWGYKVRFFISDIESFYITSSRSLAVTI